MSERMTMVGSLENVQTIRATLRITMSLDDWKRLQAELGKAWPGSELSSPINQLWDKARADYSAKIGP